MPDFNKLRRNVEQTAQDAAIAKRELENAIRDCQHNWSEVKYDPIVSGGYYVEGDTPGTMGIDFRPGFYAERREEKRWSRTCKICGKVEYNKGVDVHSVTTPKF